MRGRRPLPTSLKLVKGARRRAQLKNPEEPRPPIAAPRAPSWLNATARAKWRELVPVLLVMRVLTKADRGALAMMCDTFATYRAARDVLEREGLTFSAVTEHGTVTRPRPEVAIAQDANRQYRAWAVEFGLTPAGRARVKALPAPDRHNPFGQVTA